MEIFSNFANLRIRSKLLLFNCLTTLVLILVIGTALLSYLHVQSLVSVTVEQNLEKLNRNSQISRGLSVLFADTDLFLSTFHNNDQLQHKGDQLLAQISRFNSMTDDSMLQQGFEHLAESLSRTIEYCQKVTIARQQLDRQDEIIWTQLAQLDDNIADKLIDAVMTGEDSTILEQMATLLGGLRENMMEIGKSHAELWPGLYGHDRKTSELPINRKIDDLRIRLFSMTAADMEIADMVEQLIVSIDEYSKTISLLDTTMVELRVRQDFFDTRKQDILSLISKIESDILAISQQVKNNITGKAEIIGTFGLVLGLGLIIFIGLSTALFFENILKRPMQLVYEGVQRFSRGDLKWKIALQRGDEWNAIEEALNSMAADLTATYDTLEKKIVELEESVEARRLTEDALRKSEEKYRSIFENAVEGIYQITLEGSILAANPAFARILGYSSAEEMVETVTDIRHQHYLVPADRDRMIERILRDGVVTGFEAQFRRTDGEIIWGAVYATLQTADHGKPEKLDGIFQDITARKQAEAEKSMLEEQLRQSQKMEAMGSLAGGIAHDFNNLLHAISGYIELLLLKKKSSDPDHRYLREVQRASERATEIAQRLLTFSRKIETQTVPVDMNRVVENSLKIIEVSLPKMISIETRFSENLPLVNTDPTQMEQVVMNLAGNAADAMANGGKLLLETEVVHLDHRITLKHIEAVPGKYVVLSISDTGCGMSAETLSHIFEPFFTTKEIGKGTGLGLAIVYGIIKSFKGHITCYSEPQVGTTFKIYLPATGETEQSVDLPPEPFSIDSARGNETILVVDDEEMIRNIADEILTSLGYSFVHAGCGEEAVEIYEQRGDTIDLIILDLGMPGMGGEKCLALLKEKDPALKIIVASGYSAHRIVSDPRLFGASASIRKPYQLEEMMTTIRSALDGPELP